MTIIIHGAPRTQPDYRTGFDQRGDDLAYLLKIIDTQKAVTGDLHDALVWVKTNFEHEVERAIKVSGMPPESVPDLWDVVGADPDPASHAIPPASEETP